MNSATRSMDSHECVTPHSKVCSNCGIEKPLSEFASNRGRHEARCKPCKNAASRENYLKNRDKVLQRTKDYQAANKDLVKARLQDWYQRNKEAVLQRSAEYRSDPAVKAHESERQRAYYAARKSEIQAKRKQKLDADLERQNRLKEYQLKHYKENKHLYLEKTTRRNRALERATPSWANIDAIRAIYKQSLEATKATGVQHCVDHIVPLRGKNVCGLHVESNLQVITEAENLRKFNKLIEG